MENCAAGTRPPNGVRLVVMIPGEVRALRRDGAPSWELMAGERFVLALPAAASDAVGSGVQPTAHAVARRVGDAGTDDSLERLVSRIPLGAGGVDAFALAWWPPAGGPLTVIVHGAARVEVTSDAGVRRLDGVGVRPWLLAEFHGARALSIGAPAGGGEAWADASGLRRAGPIRATGIEWRAASAGGAPATQPIATGATGPGRSAPGATPPADAVPGAVGPPGVAEPDLALLPPAAARFRITGGEARDVASVVLIGRNPSPPPIAREPVELVRVEASARSVSSTHLELRRAGARLVATDLYSTNGTMVRTATGSRRMRAGESIVVPPGAVLELGGDTIVEIIAPSLDQAHPDRQVPA